VYLQYTVSGSGNGRQTHISKSMADASECPSPIPSSAHVTESTAGNETPCHF